MSANHADPSGTAPHLRGTLSEVCRELAARPYARRGVPPAETPIRVMLADDHAIVRAGIRALLRALPDVTVVAEAATGDDAVAVAERVRPDVLVMDLDMPHGDGASAAAVLAAQAPEVRILILTMYPERERLLAMLEVGAHGYLTKDAADRDLAEAIRVVASGDVYVRPAVARELATHDEPLPPELAEARAWFGRLSDRERTVVDLTARGFNGPEIGRQLGITAKTVDTYKQRIEQKLGISHRTEYVQLALDAHLLNPSR
jgi:Response regulator containing a CheY-like receiver domain and an HTH DNA-binding domain